MRDESDALPAEREVSKCFTLIPRLFVVGEFAFLIVYFSIRGFPLTAFSLQLSPFPFGLPPAKGRGYEEDFYGGAQPRHKNPLKKPL